MTEEEVKEKIGWPAVKERMEKFLVLRGGSVGNYEKLMGMYKH
jgi:hypothetical protein